MFFANYNELYIGPSLTYAARSPDEFFLPFLFGYLAYARNDQTALQTEQASRSISVNRLKPSRVNPVRYCVNAFGRKPDAFDDRFAHAVADGYDSRHVV